MGNGAPRLRICQPEDLTAIHKIDRDCFPPGIAYSRTLIREALESPEVFGILAEAEGRVVGFVMAHARGSDGHLITLDVIEACRRRGIGSQLLLAAETELAARGVTHLALETATENAPAIAFWQKHGYRIEATVKNYYGRKLDAYAMSKRLRAA
jgi:ribosomal-protein-alanine N-acetyltransferase